MLKKHVLFSVFFLMPIISYAQSDPCSSIADLKSKTDTSEFVGFGAGDTQKEADQNAQIDLASKIRQKVTATSTVTENNTNSELQSTSKSVVSEILIGSKTFRRCKNKDSFSSIMTLDKNFFISSLEEKLSTNIKKAKTYINTLKNPKSEGALAQTVDGAKKFLSLYQDTLEGDLELCKIYKGCVKIKEETAFDDLVDLVEKEGDKDQYLLITKNDEISTFLRDDLVGLLEDEGVKIMDGAVSDETDSMKRKILASCKLKIGSKILPDSNDKIVETRCILEGYIGKQKNFRKVYSCKAMADENITREEAVNVCSGRMKKE